MTFLCSLMTRLMRWLSSLELAHAEYRMQRINDELAYGDVRDLNELIVRKSNIAVEIRRIRKDIEQLDAMLTPSLESL